MAVTIRDVARRAGVSPSTASRALNGKGRMHPETRARVLRAAKELGYRPNVHAKGLATKRTECIGVAIDARHIPLESTSFYGPVLEAIEVTLAAEGYHTVFTVLRQHQPPRCALEGRVDGLVFLGTDIGEDIVTPVKEIPVVLVDNHLPGFDGVVGDNLGGRGSRWNI